MASTLSTGALGLEKITTGEQAGTWGSQTNINLETGLEIAIAGTKNIAVTTADVTLTVPSGTSITDIESRAMALNITGALTGNRAVIVPAKSKSYIVKNSGSGAYTLTVKTAAGSGVIVSQGDVALLYCDGTNVLAAPSAAATHAATTKATPVDADEIPLVDSATTNQWIPKKLTWANLKTTLAAACSAGWNAATATTATTATNTTNAGGQIPFPATQNASADANTLDDYEEGTWTPTITAEAGTFTSVSATGYYTKIGRQVTATFVISIVTNGTAALSIRATLPFTAVNHACGTYIEYVSTFASGSVLTVGTYAEIRNYLGAYPGGTGYYLRGTVTYTV